MEYENRRDADDAIHRPSKRREQLSGERSPLFNKADDNGPESLDSGSPAHAEVIHDRLTEARATVADVLASADSFLLPMSKDGDNAVRDNECPVVAQGSAVGETAHSVEHPEAGYAAPRAMSLVNVSPTDNPVDADPEGTFAQYATNNDLSLF